MGSAGNGAAEAAGPPRAVGSGAAGTGDTALAGAPGLAGGAGRSAGCGPAGATGAATGSGRSALAAGAPEAAAGAEAQPVAAQGGGLAVLAVRVGHRGTAASGATDASPAHGHVQRQGSRSGRESLGLLVDRGARSAASSSATSRASYRGIPTTETTRTGPAPATAPAPTSSTSTVAGVVGETKVTVEHFTGVGTAPGGAMPGGAF